MQTFITENQIFSDHYTSLLITTAGNHSLLNLRHMVRTSFMLRQLFNSLESSELEHPYTSREVDSIVRAAAFHDIGKVFLPDSIYLKPGQLSQVEYNIMKLHTTKGSEFAAGLRCTLEPVFASYLIELCLYHHERWNGTGYPEGLSGEAIPYAARLMSIVDVYDALTHDRPYRQAMTHEAAMEIIEDGKGSHFDPVLVEVFVTSFND